MDKLLVTRESQIIEIPVTPEMLKFAKEKAKEMGVLNKHSMMKGERNVDGILGELAALSYLSKAKATDTFDHDLSIQTHLGLLTIDVKTKRLAQKPRLYYDCTVYGYNPNQKCHLYLFTGVKSDHSVVWICGYLPKYVFYEERAEFCPAGSQRPLGGGKMLTYKEDNYVVRVNQIRTAKRITELDVKPTT